MHGSWGPKVFVKKKKNYLKTETVNISRIIAAIATTSNARNEKSLNLIMVDLLPYEKHKKSGSLFHFDPINQ